MALAEEFCRLLETNEVRNRAELARRYRLTRARVTQLLDLLKLDQSVIAYAKSLPAGTPTRRITERALRRLLKLKGEHQVNAARQNVWGFNAFLRSPKEQAEASVA
jgi:hypothetical protein